MVPPRRNVRRYRHRLVSVYVRNGISLDKLQRRVAFKERRHSRRIVEECVDAWRIKPISKLVFEIGSRT